jgi:RNA polymerase sigma-B factor
MSTSKLTAAQKRRNQRVSRYLQLVRPVAVHYARCCREPLDDLIQVGLLGLLRAAELYSQAVGTPFDAFAKPHIRGAILHYLRDAAPLLRLPRRLGERQHQVRRFRRQWLALHGCEPQVQDLRAALGLSQPQWDQLQQASRLAVVVPLDASRLEQELAPAVEVVDQQRELAISALGQLQPGLRDVVRQVVLEGRSYRTAAAALQVSPMTVQRRLHRGLAELRRLLSSSAPQPHLAGSAVAAC